MKKLLKLLIVTIISIALFTACSDTPLTSNSQPKEYTPGTLTDSGYINEYLGLQFTDSENFIIAPEEYLESTQGFSDTAKAEFQAVNPNKPMNIIVVMSEKLENNDITVQQYIESAKKLLKEQIPSLSASDDLITTGVDTIAGLEFDVLTFSMQDIASQSSYITRTDDGYIVMITFCYTNSQELENLKAAFSTI